MKIPLRSFYVRRRRHVAGFRHRWGRHVAEVQPIRPTLACIDPERFVSRPTVAPA
jgi:hypothetical protein